ncbi:hypothetical protein CFP56_009629 [Quercus suber]|uniref:Ankyrin repeat family protein n=1 Tax=Quercus suber TaxID=58331 RepID=A0AAW0M5Q6_QUESU
MVLTRVYHFSSVAFVISLLTYWWYDFSTFGDGKEGKDDEDKERKKDDIDQPATAIIIARRIELLKWLRKSLNHPIAIDRKNVVLLTVKHKQPRVYELLLLLRKKNTLKYSIFNEVDCDGNSALHLAAEADFNWPVLGVHHKCNGKSSGMRHKELNAKKLRPSSSQ